LARKLSAASHVLLKNTQSILPIDLSKVKKIAILGDDAHDNPQVAGDGSGHVINGYVVTALDGIKARIGNAQVEVSYANTS